MRSLAKTSGALGTSNPRLSNACADLLLSGLLFRCQLDPAAGQPHRFTLHLDLALRHEGLKERIEEQG